MHNYLKINLGILSLVVAVLGTFFLNVASAFLLLLFSAAFSIFHKKNSTNQLDSPGLLMFVWLAWLTLAQHWSAIGSIGWITTWIFMAIPIGFLGWRHQLTTLHDWKVVELFLAALGCGLGLWGIIQVVILNEPRAAGSLADPNTYGCLLNLIWFPIFTKFLASPTRNATKTDTFSGLALTIIHMALMMSGSRAAAMIWLMLFIGTSYLLRGQLSNKRLVMIGITACGNYLLYFFFSNHLGTAAYKEAFDVLQNNNPSAHPRLLMWQSTLNMWLDSPWLGHGLGSWNYLYPAYRMRDETGTAGYYAHNDYLQLLQEGGLFMLIIFIGILSYFGAHAIKATVRMPDSPVKAENIGILAGIAAAVLHAFVNFTFYLIYINVFIGIYLGKISRHKNDAALLVENPTNGTAFFKIAISILIILNGFHAFFTSSSLALLRDDSLASRVVNTAFPQLTPYNTAAILTAIRPSDSNAQRYIAASLENSLIHNPSLSTEQAQEMLREVIDIYALLRQQNQLDASIPANEASVLLAFDERYGLNLTHLQNARLLLAESLQKDPSRAESAILLSETYFVENRPPEAYELLSKAALNVWNERDRMLIETEVLKHQQPELSTKLQSLQQQLREIKIHCWGPRCSHNADILELAKKTLDTLRRNHS